jgi:peroxiredoxin
MRALLLLAAMWAGAAGGAEPPQTLTAVAARPAAPDFTLTDLDGKTQRLSDYRGKVVLINFWATWCPPCRRELPSMQRLWQRLKDKGFAMLALDVGEEEDAILPFLFSTGVEITFPVLLDKPGQLINAWPVRALPTSFLLDREGRIVYRAVGGREWDDPALIEKIQALLKQ